MKKTAVTRGWNGAVLCFGVVVGMALCAPALAVAQTAADAEPAQVPAQASVQDAQAAVRGSEVGHSTRAWLDLQRSNAQAAPMLPTLGSEAGLAYLRYMESFKSKIPDLYGSTLGGGGGGGGGGGASSGGASSAGGLN